jgi:hypothetical protein
MVAAGVLSFLLIALAESIFFFPPVMRMILFYGFLGSSVFLFYRWVAHPFLGYLKLGKVISHEQAAAIIGQHFADVQDKLLNVLQLGSLAQTADASSLIKASIDQRIVELRPISFKRAIDLSANKRYLKYAVPPLVIFIGLLLASPSLITDSTKRLIYNNVQFEKKAPFDFTVTNQTLETVQFEPFLIDVAIRGKQLPAEVYINIEGHDHKLTRQSPDHFTYEIPNPQKNIEFYLEAAEFQSRDYELIVHPKPMIISFETELVYPKYLNKENETLANVGDLTVPEGTRINWEFQSRNTSEIVLGFQGERANAKRNGEDLFTHSRALSDDETYTIYVSNEAVSGADSIGYFLNVTKDQHPSLTVEQMQDSINLSYIFFMGEAADDHGLRKLAFYYRTDPEGPFSNQPIQIPAQGDYARFSHYLDVGAFELKPGEKLTYYFEVWDNDGVNGSKSTRSQMMNLDLPSKEEIEKLTEEANQEIKSDLDQSMKESKQLQREFKDLREELYQKKSLDWDDRKSIESLMKKQSKLTQAIEKIKKDFSENRNRQKEIRKEDQELAKKYDELQKILDESLPEELKKLMKELEEMLEKMKKKDALEELKDFEYSNEQMNKDLDRMLELFKQMEFEMKMDQTAEKLEKMAEDQKRLSRETQNKQNKLDDISKKQDKLNEDFKDVKEDLKELEDLNKELNNQPGEDQQIDKENKQEEISESQENSMQQMQQGQRKQSSGSQQKAGEKMQELSDEMRQMQAEMQQEKTEADLNAIRQLLENLVTLSFDQEDLMDELKSVSQASPEYVRITQKQHKLKEQSAMIEDSLHALSKTISEIESFVTKEMSMVNRKMDEAIDHLEKRQVPWATRDQQYVMTSTNNLAVMLLEVMKQLQQQMANQMKSAAMCKKPGGSKSAKSIGDMQKQLNQDLKKMKGKMSSQKLGKGQMSKEMAEMAARQAHLREELRKLSEELNKDGQGTMGNLEELANEMEKTETDLVNKRLTEEMLLRQQEILTRLLKAADAEREREMDNKRKSEKAKEYSKEPPPELEEYFKKREAELELYKTLPPSLKPYYRKMVENYFKSISN